MSTCEEISNLLEEQNKIIAKMLAQIIAENQQIIAETGC
jgi:hypothetical protein